MTAPAFHFEAKKHAYRQTQDGIVVSFVVHPNDMSADLAIAPLGTQYVVALAPYTEQSPPSSTGLEHGASIPAVGGSSPPADTTHPVKERKPFHTLPRSQQAALLIRDERFREWWFDRPDGSEREVDAGIKATFGIASKRDLDRPGDAADKWDGTVRDYFETSGQSTWERPA